MVSTMFLPCSHNVLLWSSHCTVSMVTLFMQFKLSAGFALLVTKLTSCVSPSQLRLVLIAGRWWGGDIIGGTLPGKPTGCVWLCIMIVIWLQQILEFITKKFWSYQSVFFVPPHAQEKDMTSPFQSTNKNKPRTSHIFKILKVVEKRKRSFNKHKICA